LVAASSAFCGSAFSVTVPGNVTALGRDSVTAPETVLAEI